MMICSDNAGNVAIEDKSAYAVCKKGCGQSCRPRH